MTAQGRALVRKGFTFIIGAIVLVFICTPAIALSPARYTATQIPGTSGFNITINAPEHVIDLMDTNNAPVVCDPNTTITMTANIDMTGITIVAGGTDPTVGVTGAVMTGSQIGTASTPFQGSFDGRCHSIVGLVIIGDGNLTDPNDTGDGLFGVVAAGKPGNAITNVVLSNAQIIGSAQYVGCLVGDLQSGTVFQCCVNATGSSALAIGIGNQSVGGVIGCVGSSGIVMQCFASTRVMGPDDVGGLVGNITGGHVQDCYVDGTLVVRAGTFSGTQPSADIGGLVGECSLGTISGCWARCSAPLVALNPNAQNMFIGGVVGSWTPPSALIIFRQNFCCAADAPGGLAIGSGNLPARAALAVSGSSLMQRATFDSGGWVLPDGIWYWLGNGVDCPRFWWQ